MLAANRLQRLNLGRIGRPRTPHARARGKDLQRVGAGFHRSQRRLFQRAKRVKMNPQPQSYMLPEPLLSLAGQPHGRVNFHTGILCRQFAILRGSRAALPLHSAFP